MRISAISGPTVQATGTHGCFMHEMVRVGADKLLGEIIRLEGDRAYIQVYEDTGGLKAGGPVEKTGELLSVELGPGLLGSIFDGIQRPLGDLAERWGNIIQRGASVPRLDRARRWAFIPSAAKGDHLEGGMVIGTVRETSTILHRIMVPPGVSGTVVSIRGGEFTVTDTVAELDTGQRLDLRQRWDIRTPRPSAGRLGFSMPMLTGQRILDTLFPVAEGGSAVVPGGFGTGKTVLEQTLAKFAAADVIVFIGCGERGNEMADVLHQFPRLIDPYTGRPLMERTVLIANTSNMPVAAREASIYTGMAIAEYFRDMGLRVAVMADSTSRWAEALREISSRLEEMPGEEGYPTYLASRIAAFYERAGRFRCLGRKDDTGAITVIGAVSPPGGDFSEPVTQASMRTAATFWALDYGLAYQRHFPAINWRTSFSLVDMAPWFAEHAAPHWAAMVVRTHAILQREEELLEIAKVVGMDAMGEKERVEMEAARLIREGYLRQSAVHPTDAFCPLSRQVKLLGLFLDYAQAMSDAVRDGCPLETALQSPVAESLLRAKELDEQQLDAEIPRIIAAAKGHFGKGDT